MLKTIGQHMTSLNQQIVFINRELNQTLRTDKFGKVFALVKHTKSDTYEVPNAVLLMKAIDYVSSRLQDTGTKLTCSLIYYLL